MLSNLMRTHFLFNPIHRPHYISYNISFFFFTTKISQRARLVTNTKSGKENMCVGVYKCFASYRSHSVATREIHICSHTFKNRKKKHHNRNELRSLCNKSWACRKHQAVNTFGCLSTNSLLLAPLYTNVPFVCLEKLFRFVGFEFAEYLLFLLLLQ